MPIELSPPTRRLVAVGLLVLTLAVMWGAVFAPLIAMQRSAADTIERLQPVLERSRAAARDIGALEAEVKRLDKRQSSLGGFLDGANESIAAAQLQTRLKAAVDRAAGTLRSVQVLPPRDEARFRRVAIKGQMLVDLSGLQRIVYDIEASVPYLFVDDIEIAQHVENRAGKTSTDNPLLDVGLNVSGYMRRGP